MPPTSERRGLHGPVDREIFVLEPPARDELQEALNRLPELWGSCRGEITVNTKPTGAVEDWTGEWEAEWDEFL